MTNDMNWFTDLFREKSSPPEPVVEQKVGLSESEISGLSPLIRKEIQRLTELASRAGQTRADRGQLQRQIEAAAETDRQLQKNRLDRDLPRVGEQMLKHHEVPPRNRSRTL